MDQPRPDETLRDFLQRRERELTQQIYAFRSQLAPKENELAEIRRTKAALGMTAATTFFDLPNSTPDDDARDYIQREEVYRSLARTVRNSLPSSLKIKELILRAFIEHLREGCTPSELGECISRAYGRQIESGSIRPTLARLREDGVLMRGMAGKWMLDPDAATVIFTEYQDSDLLKTAAALAWREDDEQQPSASRPPETRPTETSRDLLKKLMQKAGEDKS